MNSELFKQMNYLHRNHNPGAIVDSAGAQIPGIQMRRRNDDLLEMFAALPIRNHVVAFHAGQRLGS